MKAWGHSYYDDRSKFPGWEHNLNLFWPSGGFLSPLLLLLLLLSLSLSLSLYFMILLWIGVKWNKTSFATIPCHWSRGTSQKYYYCITVRKLIFFLLFELNCGNFRISILVARFQLVAENSCCLPLLLVTVQSLFKQVVRYILFRYCYALCRQLIYSMVLCTLNS